MLAFTFYAQGKPWHVKTNLVGEYNFPNAMAAVAIGLDFGIFPELIVKSIEGYTPSNHRSQWVDTARNQVVIDAYNANPTSMEAALQTFFKMVSDRPRVVIMGEMRELGLEGVADHQRLAEFALNNKDCRVIMVGDGFKSFAKEWYKTSADLLAELQANPVSNSLVLVKGSRGNKLEVVLPAL
jgi:UDP-N-acetylmuramoyl-tripeptide--D-alanyl-D-alanine ligase